MFVVPLVCSGLCEGLVGRSEEFLPGLYVCLVMCDLEDSTVGGLGPIFVLAPRNKCIRRMFGITGNSYKFKVQHRW